MTRFQDLLKPDAASSPKSEQERAIRELPNLVRDSGLSWWEGWPSTRREARFLLIVVASYSHYDLAMLDVIVEELDLRLSPARGLPVYVANLLDYSTPDDLKRDFSFLTQSPSQMPVAAYWKDPEWLEHATGKPGRDLVAREMGISPERFNARVIDRVPRYTPSISG